LPVCQNGSMGPWPLCPIGCANGAPNYPLCTFTCSNGSPGPYPQCPLTCPNGSPGPYPDCPITCANGSGGPYPQCPLPRNCIAPGQPAGTIDPTLPIGPDFSACCSGSGYDSGIAIGYVPLDNTAVCNGPAPDCGAVTMAICN
jgi:hypothetical protein